MHSKSPEISWGSVLGPMTYCRRPTSRQYLVALEQASQALTLIYSLRLASRRSTLKQSRFSKQTTSAAAPLPQRQYLICRGALKTEKISSSLEERSGRELKRGLQGAETAKRRSTRTKEPNEDQQDFWTLTPSA